jgi:DNA-binding NtrC family response regulator
VPLPEPFSRLRLLIVDDDPALAEFLREGLKNHFSLIVVVAGFAQAKSLMDGPFIFHAVVCDYKLTDGTGLDFYQWLRQVRGEGMPFIMISGETGPLSQDDDPAFAFLAKPFPPAELWKLLQEVQAQARTSYPAL